MIFEIVYFWVRSISRQISNPWNLIIGPCLCWKSSSRSSSRSLRLARNSSFEVVFVVLNVEKWTRKTWLKLKDDILKLLGTFRAELPFPLKPGKSWRQHSASVENSPRKKPFGFECFKNFRILQAFLKSFKVRLNRRLAQIFSQLKVTPFQFRQ